MTFYNENEYISILSDIIPADQSAMGVFFIKDGENDKDLSAMPFDLSNPNGEVTINENIEKDLSSLALSLCVAKMNTGGLGRDVTVGVVAVADDLTNASRIAKIISDVFADNAYVGFIIGTDRLRWENSKTGEFGFTSDTTDTNE